MSAPITLNSAQTDCLDTFNMNSPAFIRDIRAEEYHTK